MSTFELQTYQNGGWQFDAYFDDKGMVVSEAEKMDATGRYVGVRVLEEKFNEAKQTSSYSTIFSRLKKDDPVGAPRKSASSSNATSDKGAPGSASKRQPSRKAKKGGNTTLLLFGGIAMVVAGIFAILALREFSGSL